MFSNPGGLPKACWYFKTCKVVILSRSPSYIQPAQEHSHLFQLALFFPFSFNDLYVSNLASLLRLLLGWGGVHLERENRPKNAERKFRTFPLSWKFLTLNGFRPPWIFCHFRNNKLEHPWTQFPSPWQQYILFPLLLHSSEILAHRPGIGESPWLTCLAGERQDVKGENEMDTMGNCGGLLSARCS